MKVTKELDSKLVELVFTKFKSQFEEIDEVIEQETACLLEIQSQRIQKLQEIILNLPDGIMEILNEASYGNFSDRIERIYARQNLQEKMFSKEELFSLSALQQQKNELEKERSNFLRDVRIALEYTNKREGIQDIFKEFGLA